MTTLPTCNPHWGFHGTIARGTAVEPEVAWTAASAAIAAATGASVDGVRDFLDSRHGRHFADEVANGLGGDAALEQAIASAVDRWMGWRIGRRIGRETGIPAGLPYLTGLAAHFEIMADA